MTASTIRSYNHTLLKYWW